MEDVSTTGCAETCSPYIEGHVSGIRKMVEEDKYS